MSGISDVAHLAGVSKSTASRALSGAGYVSAATKERVAAAAASLGYVPSTNAQSLSTGRTQNIGVVMPYINRWFFAEVLEGIQQELLERGLDLMLYDAKPGTESRRRIFEDFLARKRFDGLIAVGLEPAENELESMLSLGKPVVSVIGDHPRTSAVSLDEGNTAHRATEHLIALGHRDIAFLGAGADPHRPHVESARVSGYHAAMRRAGLDETIAHVPCALTMPSGYAAAVDLLSDSRARPTAIVAACDEVAIGAIIAARRLGIQVPAALSVVGIDDHEHAEMFALTTLHQDPREQGRTAVDLLMRQIEDPDAEPVVVRVKPRLVVRNSTAPVNPSTSVVVADNGILPVG
ncbi:LacI family transcriptional regulator [Microbacterium sp. cx-55]|uniref:LacI family DNA-binding transcriptional regulator n=1 Tax=unclassified Microbacterium TaxID=2609290 RepID=UPI001CBB3452|nr:MULTISPECIES: LacI family DNA-binding transcriptional regulator [unclassified Microbacterium]MBZ4487939.1 LacI family transcriptional regulator [Microbacterium sp. cx-55]MCC4909026.1 LacI family transcriptional regulator [Microbacterium sp. cx-59]UGB34651.1 LacI family transcriptional regulator [Microbacterium sp. cx-55]